MTDHRRELIMHTERLVSLGLPEIIAKTTTATALSAVLELRPGEDVPPLLTKVMAAVEHTVLRAHERIGRRRGS